MSRVKKAIIPAAGLGTRFLPATKAMPKEMLPILDKPTIQYIVEEAVSAGIEDIIIVTGKHKRAIEDHFDNQLELEMNLKEKGKQEILDKVNYSTNLANIFYVRQKKPIGLGHAVYTARQFIGDEPFAVLLGDDIVDSKVPSIKQLMDIYDEKQASVIGVTTVPDHEVSKYGIVEYIKKENDLYEVVNLYEKPNPQEVASRLAIMGRYILTPNIFEELEKEEIGSGNEIQLTDAIHNISQKQKVYAYSFEGRRFDVGNKLGFVTTNIEYALKSDMSTDVIDFMRSVLSKYEK